MYSNLANIYVSIDYMINSLKFSCNKVNLKYDFISFNLKMLQYVKTIVTRVINKTACVSYKCIWKIFNLIFLYNSLHQLDFFSNICKTSSKTYSF